MTALYFILGMLLVLFLLLLFPFIITADLNSEPEFIIKYLFFKIRLPSKKKEKNNIAKKSKKTKSHQNKARKKKKKQSISSYVEKYGELLKDLLKDCGVLLHKIVIKELIIKLKVSGSDAAETAIEYGAVCAIIYPAVSAIEQSFTLKKTAINISADFKDKESVGSVYIKLYLRPLFILSTAISALKSLVKFKNKK